MSEKQPFDVDAAMALLRKAVRPYPPAALFQLADEGFATLFQQLVACILSIRTRDETTLVVARSLFGRARTAAAIVGLTLADLDATIRPCSFHEAKAYQIQEIARRTVAQFGGELPCDEELLLSFAGVGPKCAHLALSIACHQPKIAVDVHVHRVTNRWGYVEGRTPEETMGALERVLPERYWIEINRLLVPFGKHVCTGTLPHCTTCPLLAMCQQRGVQRHR